VAEGTSAVAPDIVRHVRELAARARPVATGGPWVHRRPEGVLVAEASEGGRPAGVLDTVVVAIKDLMAVAGLPLGAGSRTGADAPPEPADATVVAALRRAGAVVAGTVALHELAFGVSGVNDELGFPVHPEDPTRIPGGSSSGSAVAVADGSADLAVGTDTGGSVRIPAALCGVVGFKPAFGTYPIGGVRPLAPSLDHVGLLARSVGEVARAHAALTGAGAHPTPGAATTPGAVAMPGAVTTSRAGPAPGTAGPGPGSTPGNAGPTPGRLCLGVDRAGLAASSPEVRGAVDAALSTLAAAGCRLVEVGWPDPDEVFEVSTAILFAEAAEVHRALMASPAADLLGAAVAARLRAGAEVTPERLAAARASVVRITAEARATLAPVPGAVPTPGGAPAPAPVPGAVPAPSGAPVPSGAATPGPAADPGDPVRVDAVVGPTVALTAPSIEAARTDPDLARALVAGTRLANITGLPALTLPVPTAGLPVGLQVVAAGNEAALAIGAIVAATLGA
jgi:Asp-tRNA(Asn)/Glu-tRNA(Gln) amidotransferase A subunit family amidase